MEEGKKKEDKYKGRIGRQPEVVKRHGKCSKEDQMESSEQESE